MISLQVFNPEGLGPSATAIVMTDEGGKRPFDYFFSFYGSTVLFSRLGRSLGDGH